MEDTLLLGLVIGVTVLFYTIGVYLNFRNKKEVEETVNWWEEPSFVERMKNRKSEHEEMKKRDHQSSIKSEKHLKLLFMCLAACISCTPSKQKVEQVSDSAESRFNPLQTPPLHAFEKVEADTVAVGYINSVKGHEEGDYVVGTFVKGRTDTLFIKNLFSEDNEEEQQYHSIIYSSNKQIPNLDIYYNVMPQLVDEGDLDGNGTTEIGILDTWYTSSCRRYCIYTLYGNRWYYLVQPIETAENLRGSGLELAEATNEKNKIRIRCSDFDAPLSCCASAPIKDTIVSASLIKIDNRN